ncbi:putative septation protein [Cladorrhinum sp. PSN259]|nr:putative septation protein [Cladorrhinum sp. PSN259]
MTVDMADGPAVSLSFANNFWGKDDAGVGPLLERMHNAKVTCDELRSFYSARASLEDEYSRKLLSLSRKSLGSQETGTLKHSLDVVRGEVESMGKQHQYIAAQMKSELEEPLAAFAGGMKERRKIVQNTVEKLLKTKIQQTQVVNKTRDRYEQECLKIKGYLAQGHMVMGQEERKNKAKLEKTQISLASSNAEYEAAVKALEDTTNRWNKEWKQAADKFQDLEEERLDFTKSSLWQFANIASTVCVSDDGSCEKIRLSLEKMEVQKDILTFISEKGTGQEIPDAPKYINFCRGDIDTQSEVSDDDNYSVAQFSRPINPAFRSSSPQPSTFESHHDPDSALAKKLGHGDPDAATPRGRGRDALPSSQTSKVPVIPQQQQIQGPPSQQNTQTRRGPPRGYQPPQASNMDYDPNEFAPVPHDPYPMDGMTMLCRPTGSDLSAGSQTSARPSSRESNSETSFSSQEQQLQQQQQQMSPVKQEVSPLSQQPSPSQQQQREQAGSGSDKKVLKKKSGFFQNHSPFRRKSTKDISAPPPQSNRNTWHQGSASAGSRPQLAAAFSSNNNSSSQLAAADRTASPDPIAANASLALNIGGNVFPVDDSTRAKQSTPAEPEDDPIAMALAELKGVTQQVSASRNNPGPGGRISADHYSGLATPAPGTIRSGSALTAAMRGTPPPSYDQQVQVQRLGVPPPAVTSRAMKESSQKFQQQTRSLFSSTDRPGSGAGRPPTRGAGDVPRATSPAPTRSASPGGRPTSRGANTYRSTSPNPHGSTSHRGSTSSHHSYSNSQSQLSMTPKREGTTYRSSERNSPSIGADGNRSASPNPYANRPGSSMSYSRQQHSSSVNSDRGASYNAGNNSMALSLVGPNGGAGGGGAGDEASLYGGSQRGRHNRSNTMGGSSAQRGMSLYDANRGQGGSSEGGQGGMGGSSGTQRARSKSVAADPNRFTRDGRQIMHFARALYMYQAAIPEELGFGKGDVLAILRHQDDGWWEATIQGGNGQVGLVPSNYLQPL